MIYKFTILSLFFISFSLAPVFAIPPIDSIHFDDSDEANFIFKGSNTITTEENPSYQLNGFNDHLILESNLPEKLNDFSISVWVKPNFKIGAPSMLSVVSELDAFNLSISNDKIDKNVVIFSVYDGIKWHQVQSKSSIEEKWTHISATYSDETIKVFVNGAQEGSVRINGDYSLTYQYGESSQNSYDYINSKYDVLIGAFNPNSRDNTSPKNYFSGMIDDVTLYGSILLKDEISTIYQTERVSYKPIIQKIEEPVSNIIGVANIYGFVTDPNNLNDQKFEEISYIGYKIKKSSSEKNFLKGYGTFNNISQNPFNQNHDIDRTPSLGETLCHSPVDGKGGSYTLIVLPSFVDFHLNHGDTLGKCVN